VIDAINGQLLLSDGVALSSHFNAAMLGASPLRLTVRPLSAVAPFHTLVGTAKLAEGIPIGITLIFCNLVLAQVIFRFAYDGGVDENLVHAQHEQWLARTLGDGPFHYDWGAVSAVVHPRDAEASVSITWRGVSHLHDNALPPPRSV
jgi:hypothetical protein